MVNVIVGKQKQVKVSANNTAGIIQSFVPVTLKNFSSLTSSITNLEDLKDVDASQKTDGSTVVYNVSDSKYHVQKLNFSEISGSVDGGTF
jgi:hypothetical protein